MNEGIYTGNLYLSLSRSHSPSGRPVSFVLQNISSTCTNEIRNCLVKRQKTFW